MPNRTSNNATSELAAKPQLSFMEALLTAFEQKITNILTAPLQKHIQVKPVHIDTFREMMSEGYKTSIDGIKNLFDSHFGDQSKKKAEKKPKVDGPEYSFVDLVDVIIRQDIENKSTKPGSIPKRVPIIHHLGLLESQSIAFHSEYEQAKNFIASEIGDLFPAHTTPVKKPELKQVKTK